MPPALEASSPSLRRLFDYTAAHAMRPTNEIPRNRVRFEGQGSDVKSQVYDATVDAMETSCSCA